MLRSSYPLGKIEVSFSHALFEFLHSFTEVTATLILAISIILDHHKNAKKDITSAV